MRAFEEPEHDAENLVVARRTHCFVIMNRYPYNAGHLMVVPNREVAELAALTAEERFDLMNTLCEAEAVLKRVFKPDGMNIGMNLGREAGAGVPNHLHIHLVPRWNGDTNFMPVLADVKVVSESLAETQQRLKLAFAESGAMQQAPGKQ